MGDNLRTDRLAIGATGEYTAFHGGTVADGLGAAVSTMDRVNGIHEREVSVRMVLGPNNDLIMFANAATDGDENADGLVMLTENVDILNANIGSGNFDVGHVVSTGGGIASFGVICSDGKARGVTGLGGPVDDAVAEGTHVGTITHSASGGGYNGVSVASVTATITDNDPFIADLAITNLLFSGPLQSGIRVTHEVAIDNQSSTVDANSAFFNFSLPVEPTNVTWTCIADVGAFCPPSGVGLPAHTVSMARGTGMLYWISADLPPTTPEGTPINSLATIESLDTSDPDLSNNSAARIDIVGPDGVFKDGFE
ncbi:MAG: hypothetical protein IPK97_05345 [Ahniella sp.]|nr:hypothetical protein [Ahniella sp.]